MSLLGTTPRAVTFGLSGALIGGLVALATISITASAIAQGTPSPREVLDVTHAPTLLRAPGDSTELVYDVHCAAAGVEDAEAGCRVAGTVFARAAGSSPFRELRLEPTAHSDARLSAAIPRDLLDAAAFEYFAVVSSSDVRATVTVPVGGASAPTTSRRLDRDVSVDLGRHAFGALEAAGQRVASAPWGHGPHEVGLEPGRTSGPIGASSIDIDPSGAVVVFDHANHRLLRWSRGSVQPELTPISVNGTIGDLATAADGSVYVLETTSRNDRNPLIRRFEAGGRELEAIEAAERGPAQIRIGPNGPLVLQHPSHQWMPAMVSGAPATPAAQRRRGRDARQLPSGAEVVVQRIGNELRLALLDGGSMSRSWRIASDTALGEVQLAEPVGARFVVVVRVYDDATDEFAVLVLDRGGLRSRTRVAAAEWAEGAPLGRFRRVGTSLYRLGTSPTGAFVDRFELEVR